MASIIVMTLGLMAHGTFGTKQYPGQAPFVQQPYQVMGQQPYPVNLMNLQAQPFAQSVYQPSLLQSQQTLADADNSEADATPMALAQLTHGTASIPMQDVMGMEDNVMKLEKKTKSLQKQLADARANEQQLNGMAYAAQSRSNSVEQSAQKLEQLAQTSVLQTQKSIDQEKTMVSGMKKKLQAAEKERETLQHELAQSQATVKSLQGEVQSWQLREREEVKAQQAAEQAAREAELRASRSLKAAELEDKSLLREQELMNRLSGASARADPFGDRDMKRFVQSPQNLRLRGARAAL